MDFSWALTSKRMAALVIPPLVGWLLTHWPEAMPTLQSVCGAFLQDPAVTACTPDATKTFLISNLTLLAIGIVAVAFRHGKLTLSKSKAQAATPDSESGANQP